MGFLKGLLNDAIGDGVKKAVSGAVESAVGKVVAPAAENLANAAAKNINDSANAMSEVNASAYEAAKTCAQCADAAIPCFPVWDYSPLVDSDSEETDEYVVIRNRYKTVDENTVDAYVKKLEANGFHGDFQIQRKTIGGKEYTVDFTFVFEGDDCEIDYYIAK